MNIPFLDQLARQLATEFGLGLGNLTVVFPNRRAGLFFRSYLAQRIEKPIWSPEILSIEEFFERLSPLKKADPLKQVFALYQAFRQVGAAQDSFDRFFYWGEVLLRDFEEVDKYLVNPDDLFYLLKAQKEIDARYDYLTADQRAVIASFWQSYAGQEEGEDDFSRIWEALAGVYQVFGDNLAAEGLATEGKLHRLVAEAAQNDALESPFGTVVFAGFHALTLAEETVVKHYIREFGARMVWDVDAYYINNKQQEAGETLRKYREDRQLGKFFPDPLPERLATPPTEVKFTGVPLAVGQAKTLGQQLKALSQTPGFRQERTVVVLPDENLLFPVLHSLPEEITEYNVTMGYPLRQTLLYAFLEHTLALQQGRRTGKDYTLYPYRHVVALLRHPFMQHYEAEVANEWVKNIEHKNQLWVPAAELQQANEFYEALFTPLTQESALFDYLLEVLRYIQNHLPWTEGASGHVEQEYLYHFYLHINRLRDVTVEQGVELKLDTLLKLFRTLIRSLRIPFSGEPLNGLQVMGVLETRNLDFDHVFMLSMNEDTFPTAPNRNSFIPYNLRKGFGLPTFDESDSVSAYLFYRLLQQAQTVHCFYNTEDTSQMKGEPSRLLQQLKYESGWPIEESVLAHPMELSSVEPITIQKTEAVLERMRRWQPEYIEEGKTGLTPSALSTYLACHLRFYFKYVAGIREPDEVDEQVDARVFGNLLHNTLEEVYLALMEKNGHDEVRPEDFTWLRQFTKEELERQFANEFGQPHKPFHFEGRNVLIREVILELAYQILKFDEKHAPFRIVGVEATGMKLDLPLPNGQGAVRIEGIIDRIDEKDGHVRVIDYKTGKDEKRVPSIESLFERHSKKRNKAAFQTMLYGLLYRAK